MKGRNNIGAYDNIVVWGVGESFLNNYQYQFRIDYLFDKNQSARKNITLNVPFISMKELSDVCQSSNTLIVVASNKYYEDIIREIRENKLCCDTVRMKDLLAVYGIENKSFCLWGIDALVKDILQRSGYQIADMSYIEIGANHPIHGSATEAFYLLGARGILIEPNPDCIPTMQELRPEDRSLNCGVGGNEKNMKFYRFADNSYRNSFDYVEVEKNIARGYQLLDEIEVPVFSIDDIIKQYNVDTSKTYLSIQVMGSELEVLNNFSFEDYDFPIISIAYYSNQVLDHKIFSFYKEIARVPRHAILVKPEIYDAIFK